MPVTMPRIFTVVPLQAALAPSVWMLVIGTMPSAPAAHGCGPTGPPQVSPHFVGVGVSGPLKSSDVVVGVLGSAVLAGEAAGTVDGCATPAPSR